MKLAGQLLFFNTDSRDVKNMNDEQDDVDDLRLLPILVSKDLPSLID